MKKLFWLILAMCLLVVPAMAEEACDHPYGSCDGRCYACNQYVDNLAESECPPYLVEYEYNDTHHWGVCSNCGTVEAKTEHYVYCDQEECYPCGAPVTAATPLHHGAVSEDYAADDNYHWYDCFACGEKIDKAEHDVAEWETMWEPAACSGESGMQIGVCKICGEECYKAIPFEGEVTGEHVFSNYREMKAATCTEPGMEMSLCALCGREDDMREIPALGHDKSRMIEREAATCTEHGMMYGHCPVCEGEIFSEIPALGHTVTKWEIVAEPAACMGWDGRKVGACDTCGEEIWETIPFEGEIIGEHVFETWMEMTPATCTEAGEEMSLCSYCGREDSFREIAALGHEDGEMEVTKEATCLEPGQKAGKCTRCGVEGESVEIPALGHDEVWKTTKEATCLEGGEQTCTCARCEAHLGTKSVEALGHTVTKWETVAEPAACMGWDGRKVGACDTCGEEVWDTIPFEGEIIGEHVFETWMEMTPATCTEAGEETSLCSYCGREDSFREIAALGHEDGEMEVTKEATCLEPGQKAGKCTRCGAEGETVEIPALGHDEVWKTTKEANCLEDGEQTGVCARCAADLGTKPIEALGHDEGEWVVIKKATREEEGLKELQCTRCGEVLDSEVIPMVTITYYPNNTACLDGTKFCNLENPVTDKWYTFVEVDLSQDGVQVFDLIASSMFRIGTVTLTVSEGILTVEYDLISDEIVVASEFLTLFTSLEEVTTVDQAAFTNYAYGEPINIQEALNGTTGYLYLCNGVNYHDQIPGLVRVWGR